MSYKKIKTWEDACKVHGIDPTKLPTVSKLPKKFREWIIATYKLGVITEAINTSRGKIWTPNYFDANQTKYSPWFIIEATADKPSGSGFSYSSYDYWDTYSGVGSRLCFEKRDQVSHLQKHFKDLLIQFHLIQD